MSGRGSTVVWSALFATLMAVAGAAYLPGLRGPLLLDDYSVLLPLVGLPAEELLSVKNLFSSSGLLGRPLAMSTFALDALLHGERWASWKLTNLGIHLINAALLFALVRTLAHAVTGQWKHTGEIAFAVAALWLLHPLHVSTVLYTVQRMALFIGV